MPRCGPEESLCPCIGNPNRGIEHRMTWKQHINFLKLISVSLFPALHLRKPPDPAIVLLRTITPECPVGIDRANMLAGGRWKCEIPSSRLIKSLTSLPPFAIIIGDDTSARSSEIRKGKGIYPCPGKSAGCKLKKHFPLIFYQR